jgi:acyl-CoA synthetase (AMP-forming)/AMP-acid ligase II
MEMHYATLLEAMADELGSEDAIVFGDKRLSWSELDNRAARLAQVMLDAGIGPGDRVGLFLYNCSEYMEAMLAALKIRAVPININYRYRGSELRYLLDDSGAAGLIFHTSLQEQVMAALDQGDKPALLLGIEDGPPIPSETGSYELLLNQSDPAARIQRLESDTFMLYTGGTTGMPKGVMYEIGEMTSGLANLIAHYLGMDLASSSQEVLERAIKLHADGRQMVSMPASPLMHTAGVMNGGIAMQLLGGTMVILTSRSLDAGELWSTVERESVNYMVIVGDAFAVPMLEEIERAASTGKAYDASSLKAVVSSGVMWSANSKRRFLELGDVLLIDGMGATEGAMAIQLSSRTMPPADTARFTILPDTVLFDENDQPIAAGSGISGHIGIGSALLPKGYFGDPEKTAKTFREIGGKRYGFTGDMGILEADNTLIFLGRGSGCINTGGEKVYPEEVEKVIKMHPEVEDCLVVGIDDPRFGQKVTAVIASSIEASLVEQHIKDHCAEALAGYKAPRTILAVAQIMRGPNGKPDYKWARDTVLQRDG